MDQNQLNLMIALLGAISAFLAILLMMFYRLLDQRRKLNISPIYQVGFIESNGDVRFDQMYMSIRVLNIGSQHLYVYAPCIKLPRKINGFDLHQIVTPDEKFPQKVESGQEYVKKTSLDQIVNLLESDLGLKSHEKVNFQVIDTFDKKHESKKIKLSELKVELNKITSDSLK